MIVFDFEVFKYDWLFVSLDLESEEYITIENDCQKMTDYYEQHKNDIWIGYNCKHYDKYILQAILEGVDPKVVNDYIIGGGVGWKLFENKLDINLYDCMIIGKSLKQVESYFGVDIRETEVDFNINRPLTSDERKSNILYCMSDVRNTALVFMHNISEFNASMGLIKLSKSSLRDLSKTKAQLSAKILGAKQLTQKEWSEEWDFEYNQCVKDYDYKHKDVIEFFDNLKEIQDPNAKYECDLYGVPHVFALGGIHGALPNYISDLKDNEIIYHIDVASYYPHIMTEWGFLSRALPSVEEFKKIMELRLKYKKENNPLQSVLKISINGTYGQSGAGKKLDNGKYKVLSPIYDPKRMREVCINGQLMLLQLIEDLSTFSADFCLIQSNTDGLIYKIPNNKFNDMDRIVKAWEKRSRMTMEYDTTTFIAQSDVNNYIAVFDSGKIERKGGAVKESKPCDYDLPIVKNAVVEYFVNGTDPVDYIMKEQRLMPFMKTYKLSSAYDRVLYGDEEQQGKVFRVFASRSRRDDCLYKQKNGKNKEKFAGCPLHCKIVNEDIRNTTVPTWLDRNWYIDAAYGVIARFKGDK